MVERLNSFASDTLLESLGIEFTHLEENRIRAKMPVDKRTIQPAGILSGGASLALAESIGGALSYMSVDINKMQVLGVSITANHVRTAKKGYVYAIAEFLHKGRKTHVITIDIFDEDDNLVSSARLTNMVVPVEK